MNTRLKVFYIFLSAIVLFTFGCERKSQLPKDVPNNLEIRFECTLPIRDTGRFYNWVSISGNQMVFAWAKCDGEVKIPLSDEEIKYVYESFVKNGFDLIENEESPRPSAEPGFNEITLRFGNFNKSVKSRGPFPLSEKNEERFGQIRTRIAELLEQKTPSVSCPK
jgi:hypothetical protein